MILGTYPYLSRCYCEGNAGVVNADDSKEALAKSHRNFTDANNQHTNREASEVFKLSTETPDSHIKQTLFVPAAIPVSHSKID